MQVFLPNLDYLLSSQYFKVLFLKVLTLLLYQENLPKDFNYARFGNTSCVGDCTETQIAASEN